MKKIILLLSFFFITGQLFSQNKKNQTFLKRYVPEKHKFISIPLTSFCFINHAKIKKEESGWIMDWSVQASNKSNLLFIEMNSTDVEDWMGNDDISGSMQMVLSIPDFLDSIVIVLTSENQPGLQLINNITHDAQTSFGSKSSITLKRTTTGIQIAGNIFMTSIKPDTKQQINFKNERLQVFSLTQFHAYNKKIDKKREAEKEEMVKGLAEYITVRDSISEVVSKKYNDSLKAHPYMGPFRFWISKLNKAGYSRTTYYVTQDSVEVKTGPYDFIYFAKNYAKDKVAFKDKIDTLSGAELKILADTITTAGLKDFYDNMCIMGGLILVFQFEWEGKVTSVNVSNYYNDKIALLITFINKIVPEKYRIWYDKDQLKEMMKGCKSILD